VRVATALPDSGQEITGGAAVFLDFVTVTAPTVNLNPHRQ
jgi:hypothetical protein